MFQFCFRDCLQGKAENRWRCPIPTRRVEKQANWMDCLQMKLAYRFKANNLISNIRIESLLLWHSIRTFIQPWDLIYLAFCSSSHMSPVNRNTGLSFWLAFTVTEISLPRPGLRIVDVYWVRFYLCSQVERRTDTLSHVPIVARFQPQCGDVTMMVIPSVTLAASTTNCTRSVLATVSILMVIMIIFWFCVNSLMAIRCSRAFCPYCS